MFFGDYLLEEKLISERDLIEALTVQLQTTAPLLEILYTSGNFDEAHLISLVGEQVKSGLEIKTLLLKKEIVTKDQLEDYLMKQDQTRKPLGQILIEMDRISAQDCQHGLDAFLNTKNGIVVTDGEVDLDALGILDSAVVADAVPELQAISEEVLVPVEPEVIPSEPLVLNIPTLDFESLETFMVPEFLDVYSEAKKATLTENASSWVPSVESQDLELLEKQLRICYNDIHTIVGMARFLKAKASEAVGGKTASLLMEFVKNPVELSKDKAQQLEALVKAFLEILWLLRAELGENKTEEEIWMTIDFQILIINFYTQVAEMEVNLGKKSA